jgi:Ca2+-binding RTX toxin-like protein
MATINGTSGDDSLLDSSPGDVINGLGGDDSITAIGDGDLVNGGAGDDLVQGDGRLQTIYGGTGDDQIFLRTDHNASLGLADTVYGGGGHDTVTADFSTDTTSLTLHQTGVRNFSLSDGTALSGIDQLNLTFGSGNDTVQLNTLGAGISLDGGHGADSLNLDYSSSGRDVTFFLDHAGRHLTDAGSSVSKLTASGLAGASTFQNFELFSIKTGAGNDQFYVTGGPSVSFRIDGGGGVNSAAVDMSAHTNNLSFTLSTTPGGASAFGGDGSSLADIQTLALATGSGNDSIVSGAGDDLLLGGAGNDSLHGGAGDDTLDGGAGDDSLDGGTGVDTASYADAAAGVNVSLMFAGPQNTLGAGTDTLTNIENLTGSAFDNTLEGNGGDNVLDGGQGVDTVSYANAASGVVVSLLLSAPQNTVGAGIDTLRSFTNLTGSAHDDVLTGSGQDNVIIGGGGDDTLIGGRGADTLTGGPGADHFVYTDATESPVAASDRDAITDFSHADGDKIDVSAISPDFTLVSAFSQSPDQLLEVAKPGGFLILGDVDGDGKSDFSIFVQGTTPLTSNDFIL